MDIKYNISKFENSNIQEVKDPVSVEEPLEMKLKYIHILLFVMMHICFLDLQLKKKGFYLET